MDDGMQNPGRKDVSIASSMAPPGLSCCRSGRTASPAFEAGLADIDTAVINGEDETGLALRMAGPGSLPPASPAGQHH